MAWTTKFSGLPTQSDIAVVGDSYSGGVLTVAGDGSDRSFISGSAPIGYETLASIGADINAVLRVTSRLTGVSPGGILLGGGSVLYGPDRTDQSIVQVNPELSDWSAIAVENGSSQTYGNTSDAGATVWLTRIYWNGTGSAFAIPDAGFGGWSVAANTQSAWYSKDDGVTWFRLGDRAIAAGVVPTRVGFGAIKQALGDKTVGTVTFSSLEVMEEPAGPPPPTISNRNPGPDSWTIDPSGDVSFDITDADDNIDLSTLEITIDVGGGPVAVYSSGSFVAPYDGAGSAVTSIANGYHVNIDRTSDFPAGSVTPRVVVEDLDAQVLDVSWTFKVDPLVDHTLWALGATGDLWFSFDNGSSWNQVDTSSLSNWLQGLWGPKTAWKIYVGVADDGTYSYDETGWQLEDAGGPWWNASAARHTDQTLWCSEDDSIVCAAGWSSAYHNVIRTRPGPPGTAWVTEYDDGAGDGYMTDIHGTPDGSAIFALRSYISGRYVELLKRDSGGTWSVVASIYDPNPEVWAQVRVISETEVWITGGYYVGGTTLSGTIWKWNGTTLSVEYQDPDWRRDGIIGLWMAEDGSEGWALYQVNGPLSETDYYLHYDGASWSVDQGEQYGHVSADITQRDGVPTSAIAFFVDTSLRRYNGSAWDATYDYTYPDPGNVIWDQPAEGTGLLLRYLEFGATGSPPTLQNQNPADGSYLNPPDVPIYLEITDSDGDLDETTVVIKVNGSIAWTASHPTTGFSGFRVPITNGYAYTITPWVTFTAGEQTIQALAEDTLGNSMDETYSFWTVPAESEDWSCTKESYGFGHEPFGQDQLGGGLWCVPLEEPFLQYSPDAVDSAEYLVAIDFPLRFLKDGDVVLTKDEKADNDDLKMSVFIRRGGIPLFPFGASIEFLVFDPLDFATEVFVADRIATSVLQGNRSLRVLEEEIAFQEHEDNRLSAAVPYTNQKTGRGGSALISVARQRTDQ